MTEISLKALRDIVPTFFESVTDRHQTNQFGYVVENISFSAFSSEEASLAFFTAASCLIKRKGEEFSRLSRRMSMGELQMQFEPFISHAVINRIIFYLAPPCKHSRNSRRMIKFTSRSMRNSIAVD